MRHGETEWTKSGQHTGLTDIGLTKTGEQQAKKLGKSIHNVQFDHVFCSPLKRVRDTCELAGLSKQAIIDPHLLEWNYGDYEGLTSAEIHQTDPDWTIFTKDPPHGETAREVEHRADEVIDQILELSGTIGVFSSGHFSRVFGSRWLKLPVSYGQYFTLSTASKSLLGFEHDHPAIATWNDTSHLQ